MKKDEVEGQPMNRVVHVCAWQSEPNETDIENLVGELWESDEFGLKGDDDYEMVTVMRDADTEHIFDQLGLVEEQNDAAE